MEGEIGSIEPWKREDLQIIGLRDFHLTPTVDLTSSLVLYGSTGSVEMVIIDGRVIKEEWAVSSVDADFCLAQAQELCEEVWGAFFRAHPSLGV